MKLSHRIRAIALAAAFTSGLTACGDSSPTMPADASTNTDAMTMTDAMAMTDAPKTDAMTMTDAMAMTDATAMPDAPMGAPDWGFRPMPNGFMFENYGNTPPVTNLTAVEMRRLFGPQVCEGAAAMGTCTLVPAARQWMEQQNAGMNGGHCEGLAVLSSLFYTGTLMPMSFGNASTFALTHTNNEALTRELALWFVTQSTVPGIETRGVTPRQVVERLERDLARGRAFRGTVLGVYTSPGRRNGHAITPYAVRRPSADVAEILCYDNNYPNQEKVVSVNLTANTFRYVTSTNPMESPLTYEGDASTDTLTLADIEPRLMLPHACSFCGDAQMMPTGGDRGSVRVYTSGEGDMSIADGMGRVTGTDAMGRPVNNIPNAQVTNIRSGDFDLDSPEPVYTVPREGTLTLTLDGSRLARASESEVLLEGRGFTLGVEDINLDPMQRDTLTFRSDAPDITYRASGAETPTLVLAFQQPGADYLVELRSGAMTAGQVLRLAVNLATQRVRVSFEGSTSAPAFELYMERVSEAGTLTFRHAGVTATASTVLGVQYAGWAGDGMPLRMEVDTNGDGTVDRTEDLSDQP